MFGNQRPEDHNASGWFVEFIVNFILEGGLEFAFAVLKFLGHAVVELLTTGFHF